MNKEYVYNPTVIFKCDGAVTVCTTHGSIRKALSHLVKNTAAELDLMYDMLNEGCGDFSLFCPDTGYNAVVKVHYEKQ